MIDLKNIPHHLILAQFKANNAFSHSDIAKMFGCTIEQSKLWSEDGAPDDITLSVRACEIAIARWREASGAFSDIDRQLYENQIEQTQRALQDSNIEHSKYVDACENESVWVIIIKRIKKRLPWFDITKPFNNIRTRGK